MVLRKQDRNFPAHQGLALAGRTLLQLSLILPERGGAHEPLTDGSRAHLPPPERTQHVENRVSSTACPLPPPLDRAREPRYKPVGGRRWRGRRRFEHWWRDRAAAGAGEVTAFDAEDLWTLVVDAETVLFLDYEQGQERLWLSGEVATPPPSERARLHETLLTYNHRWRDTGGLRMSLDGEGGAVVLSYDMPAEGLELSRLAMVLTNFLDVLRAWREGIGRFASAPSAGPRRGAVQSDDDGNDPGLRPARQARRGERQCPDLCRLVTAQASRRSSTSSSPACWARWRPARPLQGRAALHPRLVQPARPWRRGGGETGRQVRAGRRPGQAGPGARFRCRRGRPHPEQCRHGGRPRSQPGDQRADLTRIKRRSTG